MTIKTTHDNAPVSGMPNTPQDVLTLTGIQRRVHAQVNQRDPSLLSHYDGRTTTMLAGEVLLILATAEARGVNMERLMLAMMDEQDKVS